MNESGPKKEKSRNYINWEKVRKSHQYEKRVVKNLKLYLEKILVPNLLIEEDTEIDESVPLEELLGQFGISSLEEAKILLEISELETIEDVRQYCREKKIDQSVINEKIAEIETGWESETIHSEEKFPESGKPN